MQKINNASELKAAIAILENKQAQDWKVLKSEFLTTYENLKPLNVLKRTVKEAFSTTEFKGEMLNTSLGIGAGYLGRLLVTGGSNNIFQKLLGNLVQVGITNLVAKHPETVSAIADIGLAFINKKSKPDAENPTEPTN